MGEAEFLKQRLLASQNSDGGWSYGQGSSWTEPTSLAILALNAAGISDNRLDSARSWLVKSQKADGGWAPQPALDKSSWVTSLACLSLPRASSTAYQRAVAWLIRQLQPGNSDVGSFFNRLAGIPFDPRPPGGSAWYPGTAAWVIPTAMSLLALSQAIDRTQNQQLETYRASAENFLFSRRCRDGGWNHGGSRYRSDNASSYPETTGVALLALKSADRAKLEYSIARASDYARSPTSIEAMSWLQMGLWAQGCPHPDSQLALPCRTTRDVCLRLLALCAASQQNQLTRA